MDSKALMTSAKLKKRFAKNIESKECVRPFNLQQLYPSTTSELRKSEMEKVYILPSNGVANIISGLSKSENKETTQNKESQSSELCNVNKIKSTPMSIKDVAGVKVNMLDRQFQKRVLTVPKIIQKSSRLKTSTESVTEETQAQKPKIKNITQIITAAPSQEQSKISEVLSPNKTVQILSGEKKLSLNPSQNCSKQILIQTPNGNIVKTMISPNVMYNTQQNASQFVTLKQIRPLSNVMMIQDGNRVLNSAAKQIKLVTNGLLNNQTIIKKSDNKLFFETKASNVSVKRDSSFLDQDKSTQTKKVCRGTETGGLDVSQDSKNVDINKQPGESSEIKHQNMSAAATKKNVMVIVPNDAAKELSLTSNLSNTSNEDLILDDNSEIRFLHDKDMVESSNFDQDTQILSNEKIAEPILDEAESSKSINQSINNDNRENLFDKFSILEKAVLSVQDDNLRAKALKALKDCGIKTKKKVVIKRPLPTKIINESAVQTNVFSLLKEGEFVEADEAHEHLIKIKSNCKFPKQPINTLGTIPKFKACENQAEYKKNLDSMIDKMFQNNKKVSEVKSALVQNKKLQAKRMLEKLLKDFELAKNYDSDGYLGIHKAIANNNLQDVQKHIIILKAAKQNIDICTEDGQTSLELAVELEVDPQIIKILLESGAQPVSSKPVHDSALILAAKKSSRILPLLLKHVNRSQQILVNATNSEGFAAIHYCAQYGNLEGVTELIRHGADVNLQDERSGRTALFYAVDTKNSDVAQEVYNEIAQKLVDNGAFSNIPTFSKHSVLSLIDEVKSHTLKIALNRAVK